MRIGLLFVKCLHHFLLFNKNLIKVLNLKKMINLILATFHEVGTIIISISQLRSMKEKEVQQFVQDHRLMSGRTSNT